MKIITQSMKLRWLQVPGTKTQAKLAHFAVMIAGSNLHKGKNIT
jgi:hypothetical protein